MGWEIGEEGRGQARRKDKDLLDENKHVETCSTVWWVGLGGVDLTQEVYHRGQAKSYIISSVLSLLPACCSRQEI